MRSQCLMSCEDPEAQDRDVLTQSWTRIPTPGSLRTPAPPPPTPQTPGGRGREHRARGQVSPGGTQRPARAALTRWPAAVTSLWVEKGKASLLRSASSTSWRMARLGAKGVNRTVSRQTLAEHCVPRKGTGDAAESGTGSRPRGADTVPRQAHPTRNTHQPDARPEKPRGRRGRHAPSADGPAAACPAQARSTGAQRTPCTSGAS